MLTQQEVHKLFEYDPMNGLLTRRVSKAYCDKGANVGWLRKDGYRATNIKGKGYQVHNIIWLYI